VREEAQEQQDDFVLPASSTIRRNHGWKKQFNSPNQRIRFLASAAADIEALRGRSTQVRLYPNPMAQGGANPIGWQ